jgi:DedD protein
MEETAFRDVDRLRDVERWKDKIEVRLDNRQVFFLFFGSAVVACMLFVLGVIVGKRIESRGRADALEVQDPLAALDRARQPRAAGTTAPASAELTFPKALGAVGPKGAAARSERATLAAAPAVPVPLRSAPALPVPLRSVPALPVPLRSAPAPTLSPAPASALPRPLAAAPRVSVAATAARPPVVVTPKPAVAVDPTKLKGKYTLQLSAFPTREEADAFSRKFTGQGTFIIPTELPGKGTWYRVRAGNFGTYQEATTAKATFEKQNKVIALIAAR